jgi:hypothetical protein
MPACSNCGKDTELHFHGLPVCVDCSAYGVILDHILPEGKAENANVETASETPSSNEPVE